MISSYNSNFSYKYNLQWRGSQNEVQGTLSSRDRPQLVVGMQE